MAKHNWKRYGSRGSADSSETQTPTTTKISRWGISRQLTRAFRGSWNCAKILAQTRQSDDRTLTVSGWPVEHYTLQPADKTYLEQIHEAVCTGAESYPHLYGVIDCPDPDHPGQSVCHAYIEPVGAPLDSLTVERPRDWYEIIYQITVAAEYDREIIRFSTTDPLQGLYWVPLESTRRLEYTLGDSDPQTLTVYHNYRVVRWTSSPVATPDDWLRRTARALADHLSGLAVPPTPPALEYLAALADGMPLTQALERWYLKKKPESVVPNSNTDRG